MSGNFKDSPSFIGVVDKPDNSIQVACGLPGVVALDPDIANAGNSVTSIQNTIGTKRTRRGIKRSASEKKR